MGSSLDCVKKAYARFAIKVDMLKHFSHQNYLINLRMNNQNHRKIVVIDGQIGYVGGFNVGDEYLGKSKKFSYWQDTHLRIVGDAVNALQLHILDWNSQATRDHISYDDRYFPDVNSEWNNWRSNSF